MRIRTVRYRKLVSERDSYGHVAHEAEAEVDDDETADEAHDKLVVWVTTKIEGRERAERLCRDIDSMEVEISDLLQRRLRLTTEVRVLESQVQQLEVKIDPSKKADDELPF